MGLQFQGIKIPISRARLTVTGRYYENKVVIMVSPTSPASEKCAQPLRGLIRKCLHQYHAALSAILGVLDLRQWEKLYSIVFNRIASQQV